MNKISRKQAKELGLYKYWPKKQCKYKHISEKYTSGNCVECTKIRTQTINYKSTHKISSKDWWKTVDRRQRMILKQRGRAKDRNIEFNLQKEDIILIENCPILGIKLDYYSSSSSADNIATIDRIDNNKGYIKGNIQIISFKANRLKNDSCLEELEKIVNYLKGLKIE